MIINDQDRETIIEYRIAQAFQAIEDVNYLMADQRLNVAVNRIYYGMFYALSALAIKHRFETSKHQQLIGWFNKTFLKDRIIDRKYGQIISRAFESRSDGDYGIFIEFSLEDVLSMYEDMKDFIVTLKTFI